MAAEASRNFDGSKGASFETYAGIRIRGAMLDEIRRGDWVPRSVHRNSRAIAEAIENVEQAHGRDARDTEVAANMGSPRGSITPCCRMSPAARSSASRIWGQRGCDRASR